MEYFILLIYVSYLVWKYDMHDTIRYKNIHYCLLLIWFILLAGCRYRIGVDTGAYMRTFETSDIPYLSDLSFEDFSQSRYQPLWIILNSFCKSIGDSFFLVQLFTSLFINSSIFYFFRKITPKYFTAILFYYITFYLYINTEIMREGMSVGLFLLFVLSIDKRKYVRGIFYMLAAYFMHPYALAILFIFGIGRCINYSLRNIFLILSMGVIFLFIDTMDIFEFVMPYLNNFSFNMTDMTSYLYEKDYMDSQLNYKGIIVRFFPFGITFLLFVYLHLHPKIYKQYLSLPHNTFNSMLLLYLIFSVLSINIPILYRPANYFKAFYILLLVPSAYTFFGILYTRAQRNIGVVLMASVLLISLGISWSTYIHKFREYEYSKYYPYYSYFSRKTDNKRENIHYYWSGGL